MVGNFQSLFCILSCFFNWFSYIAIFTIFSTSAFSRFFSFHARGEDWPVLTSGIVRGENWSVLTSGMNAGCKETAKSLVLILLVKLTLPSSNVEILTSGKSETAKSPEGRGRKSVSSPSLPFEARSAEKGRLVTGDWFLTEAWGIILLSPISQRWGCPLLQGKTISQLGNAP